MSTLKQCPRGHYYEGDVCPYCATKHYPMGTQKTRTYYPKQERTMTCYPDSQETVPTSFRETEVADIPLCPHCGRPVRKYVPMPSKEIRISSINDMGDGIVPWNYEWDGKCENCGYDFNIVMRIDMGSTGIDNKIRETRIKVNSKGFLHHITCNSYENMRSTVLSGVEIETRCGLGNERGKFFISANELKYLMKVLQNSPILKQLDYYEECLGGDVDMRETL